MHAQATRIAAQLYDGVLSPEDWYGGMAAFTEATGASNFHQLTLDVAQGMVLESLASHRDESAVDAYERHFAPIDERVPVAMRLGQGQVMLDHEHFSERHMSRSELYTDCLAPQGMKYCMGLKLYVQGSVQQYLGFLRQVDKSPFTDEDRSFALHLLPDVARAAGLRARASQLAQQAAMGLAALDALPQGLMVVGPDCRVHYGNPAAERLLAGAELLRVRHGRLQCLDGAAQAQLQQHVLRACGHQGAGLAGAQSLAGQHCRLNVAVLPLKASHAAAAAWQAPAALVLVTDPASPGGLSPRAVEQMLGLSPAEARLALLLAAGKTVKDFAAAEGVSWHTARTHLKNAMRKTACHRQLELVALLQSMRAG